MRRSHVIALFALGLSGCGNLLGISDLTGPAAGSGDPGDAGGNFDDATFAPYDVTGSVSLLDPADATKSPLPSTVDLVGPGSLVYATATASDTDASFRLTVRDVVLGGALHVRRDVAKDSVDAYALFSRPLSATTDLGNITTVTTPGLLQLEQAYFGASSIDGSVVLLTVKDSGNRLAANVVITTTDLDAVVRYLSQTGNPDPTLTETTSSGQAAIYHPKPTNTAYIATGGVTTSSGLVSIEQTSLDTVTLQPAAGLPD